MSINSKYKVSMLLDESIIDNERLKVYEYDGIEYKELEYAYSNGKIYFSINSNSEIVFATRNIEYHLIIIFGGILLFSFAFITISYVKNSKIKVAKTKEV